MLRGGGGGGARGSGGSAARRLTEAGLGAAEVLMLMSFLEVCV